MLNYLLNLDRRWIFLLMGLSIAIPILLEAEFPEQSTGLSQAVFDEIDNLPEGSRVMIAMDYDPASEGELGPMATAYVHHCCEKKHKIYFLALWPVGPQMIDDKINKVIRRHYPQMIYGEDYVNLGYKAGGEGVIKVIITDLRGLYTTDARGTSLDSIPMCRDVKNLRDLDLICNVSAGTPGTKEWVQYAVTPYPDDVRLVAGCTGVQASLMYPYIPEQLPGLLAAIKGASEYEELVNDEYGIPDPSFLEAKRRMGPQLVAHLTMIFLIVAGNVLFFMQRARGRQAQ